MQDLIERYRKLYSGVIYDALRLGLDHQAGFVLDRRIGRVSGPRKPMVGRAVTARGMLCRSSSTIPASSYLFMYENLSSDDVLVMDTSGDNVVAHFGDVSAALVKQAGAVGCVIDGYTRDSDRLTELDFPLYGRGVTPQDTMGDWVVGQVGTDLCLPGSAAGVLVRNGDLIFADGDGVLVIPAGAAPAVLEVAEKRQATEVKMLGAIEAGMKPEDVFKEFGKW